jgi:hypothetical protein
MIEIIVKFGVMWLASSLVVGILVGKLLHGSVELIETPSSINSPQADTQGTPQSKAS